MQKEVRFSSKKRHHPDGFLLSSSACKKFLPISEAETDSSIESARNPTIPLERLSDSAHGSLWNSASAVVTSDCSPSISISHSPISANVASFKHPHSDRAQWQAFSDAASYNMVELQSARDLPSEAKQGELWTYGAPGSKVEDSATADSEYSEVTHARPIAAARESSWGSGSGKATHIISRREKSSLNAKWDMDATWAKDSFGSDAMLQQKQRESNSAFLSISERRGLRSTAIDSGSSCGTHLSFTKEVRPKQGFSHTFGPTLKDSFTAPLNAHVRVDGCVKPRAIQERMGIVNYLNTRHCSTKTESNSSFLERSKVDSISPSYVLSSGRPSLEEETRMSRRASTIDHDFEEYFASLMLE